MPRVVSSAHGSLRHVLLCFPYEATRLRGYRTAYRGLFRQLPAATRLTILAHPKAGEDLGGLLAEADRTTAHGASRAAARGTARTEVIQADPRLRFTVWAQDACLALQDDEARTSLLTPLSFDRDHDTSAVATVASAVGLPVRRSPLRFHGGHVLAGDDFVLIGRECEDAERAEAAGHGEARPGDGDLERGHDDGAAQRFRNALDPSREVHFVGTDRPLPEERMRHSTLRGRDVLEVLPGGGEGPHPLAHLDMFLALAGRGATGRYRVLVGSPTLADHILGRAPREGALDAHFDDVAEQLAESGFEVIRTPLPLTYGDGRRRVDGQLRDVRLWYYATANNCLVQIDAAAGDRVWLPTYGHGAWSELAAIDEANREIWEALGFAVDELPSFHAFAQRFGALHCITKELARTPAWRTATPAPVHATGSQLSIV